MLYFSSLLKYFSTHPEPFVPESSLPLLEPAPAVLSNERIVSILMQEKAQKASLFSQRYQEIEQPLSLLPCPLRPCNLRRWVIFSGACVITAIPFAALIYRYLRQPPPDDVNTWSEMCGRLYPDECKLVALVTDDFFASCIMNYCTSQYYSNITKNPQCVQLIDQKVFSPACERFNKTHSKEFCHKQISDFCSTHEWDYYCAQSPLYAKVFQGTPFIPGAFECKYVVHKGELTSWDHFINFLLYATPVLVGPVLSTVILLMLSRGIRCCKGVHAVHKFDQERGTIKALAEQLSQCEQGETPLPQFLLILLRSGLSEEARQKIVDQMNVGQLSHFKRQDPQLFEQLVHGCLNVEKKVSLAFLEKPETSQLEAMKTRMQQDPSFWEEAVDACASLQSKEVDKWLFSVGEEIGALHPAIKEAELRQTVQLTIRLASTQEPISEAPPAPMVKLRNLLKTPLFLDKNQKEIVVQDVEEARAAYDLLVFIDQKNVELTPWSVLPLMEYTDKWDLVDCRTHCLMYLVKNRDILPPKPLWELLLKLSFNGNLRPVKEMVKKLFVASYQKTVSAADRDLFKDLAVEFGIHELVDQEIVEV